MTNLNLFNVLESFALGNMEHMSRAMRTFLPYDVMTRKEDGGVVINIAVAGYSKEHLSVTWEDSLLKVKGKGPKAEQEYEYVHTGLSKRDFSVQFPIPQIYDVEDVSLDNGILSIAFRKNDKFVKTFDIKSKSLTF